MPPSEVAAILHQHKQVWFPSDERVDSIEARARTVAHGWAKANSGDVQWASQPGAQAPERFKHIPLPKPGMRTPHPDAQVWEDKLDLTEGRGFVNPHSHDLLSMSHDPHAYDPNPFARSSWRKGIAEPETYPRGIDYARAVMFLQPELARDLLDLDAQYRKCKIRPSEYFARRGALLAEHQSTSHTEQMDL